MINDTKTFRVHVTYLFITVVDFKFILYNAHGYILPELSSRLSNRQLEIAWLTCIAGIEISYIGLAEVNLRKQFIVNIYWFAMACRTQAWSIKC